MKTHIISSLLIFGTLFSCSEDIVDPPEAFVSDDFLVIGDTDATSLLAPPIHLNYYNGDKAYHLDLDADGNDDFTIEVTLVESPNLTVLGSGITSLTSEAEFVYAMQDTLTMVDTLHYNDSLNLALSWTNTPSALYTYRKLNIPISGVPPVIERGFWKDAQNTYVGFLVQNPNNPTYGWARLEVTPTGLTIHEIMSKMCYY